MDIDQTDDVGELTVPDGEHATTDLAIRLRTAVREAGGNAAVARKIGMPFNSLSRYLAGRDMKSATLIALAQGTGVRLEWLATGAGPMKGGQPGFDERPLDFQGVPLDGAPAGTVPIPRYDAHASAGIGTTLDAGWVTEKVLFSLDFIRNKLRRNPDKLALIQCSGDSMEPVLRDGDDLLVDTSAIDPRSGPIYILRVGGALLAKRLQLRMDGGVMILSDNPRYAPELFHPTEEAQLDIVGEVVWRSGSLAI